jgi:hypothetical protein
MRPANKLVANAVKQWSAVPTSSFRAEIAGPLPFDVNGVNAGQIIGMPNGGGIQVIYDSDGSVIKRLHRRGRRRARHCVARVPGERRLDTDRRRLVIIRGEEDYKSFWPDYTYGEPTSGVVTHEFGHAINLAHSQTNGYYARNTATRTWAFPTARSRRVRTSAGR